MTIHSAKIGNINFHFPPCFSSVSGGICPELPKNEQINLQMMCKFINRYHFGLPTNRTSSQYYLELQQTVLQNEKSRVCLKPFKFAQNALLCWREGCSPKYQSPFSSVKFKWERPMDRILTMFHCTKSMPLTFDDLILTTTTTTTTTTTNPFPALFSCQPPLFFHIYTAQVR